MTHTPGPWAWDEGEEITYDQGMRSVADIREHTGFENIPMDVVKANARLIAAAPDLLAAARKSLDWLASYPGFGSKAAYDEMRAAVAKAEGKS